MECNVVLWVADSEVVLRYLWLGRVEHSLVADEPAIVSASFNTQLDADKNQTCETLYPLHWQHTSKCNPTSNTAMSVILRLARILRQKIENSACITCKYCTAFSWILHTFSVRFLPRCMECRRGLAMRFLSVCQTCALWQNERKLCLDFYIIWKNIYPSFLRRRMVGGGRPLLPEILGQPTRVGAKSPILNQ